MALSKNYLQLEFGSGLFFDYSKEEKEGYEKHESSKGNVSYRKYYKKGVTGVLDSVSLYDGKFGQQISMNIKNGEDVYYVPVDLYDQKGQVSTFAESLIKFLPALEKGMDITVGGYNFIPEGEKYSRIGIYFKSGEDKVKAALTNSYYKDGELVEGDIPALEWVEKLGKKKPSAVSVEKKDDYLLSVLQKELERLTWKNKEEEAPKVEEQKAESAPTKKEPAPSSKPNDDLPF